MKWLMCPSAHILSFIYCIVTCISLYFWFLNCLSFFFFTVCFCLRSAFSIPDLFGGLKALGSVLQGWNTNNFSYINTGQNKLDLSYQLCRCLVVKYESWYKHRTVLMIIAAARRQRSTEASVYKHLYHWRTLPISMESTLRMLYREIQCSCCHIQ